MGRGLLGVVGLPLSGALGLVGAVSSGLASTAGLTPPYAVRRPGRLAGVPSLTPACCVDQLVLGCYSLLMAQLSS